ncbi:hypothetical protein CROQUDRAFT_664065 [Cronartium quercuum f. sp. fusiforme G11]|uniref:WD40 repeat-containing protein n=1 Tax=Cronartium quercuum f. sp. fusiforme G11 TaxID=708437 RepID=A0A9P6NC33_9BASI|nr:hypothetical protein CROQUDRAFT_664065 [Cronartium quercuum f. sp. fusiforme G11]
MESNRSISSYLRSMIYSSDSTPSTSNLTNSISNSFSFLFNSIPSSLNSFLSSSSSTPFTTPSELDSIHHPTSSSSTIPIIHSEPKTSISSDHIILSTSSILSNQINTTSSSNLSKRQSNEFSIISSSSNSTSQKKTSSSSSSSSLGNKTRAALSKLKLRTNHHHDPNHNSSHTKSRPSISSSSRCTSERTLSSSISSSTRSSFVKTKSQQTNIKVNFNGRTNTIKHRHLNNLSLLHQFNIINISKELNHPLGIFTIEYSPLNPNLLAVGTESGIIYLFDLIDFNYCTQLIGHQNSITSLNWTKSGQFLLSASMDKSVRIWNIQNQFKPFEIQKYLHADSVTTVISDPNDENIFFTGSIDRKLRKWDIRSSKVIGWAELSDFITCLYLSKSSVFVGLYSGTVLSFDPQTLKIEKQITNGNGNYNKIKGKKVTSIIKIEKEDQDEYLLISTNDSKIKLYNFTTNQLLKEFLGHKSLASQHLIKIGFGLGVNGQDLIISGSEDGKVYIWELNTNHFDHDNHKFESISLCESFKVIESGSVTCAIFGPMNEEGNLEITVTDDKSGLIKIFKTNR